MTGEGVQIVRFYEDITAPTGEGTRYETVDGEVWRDTRPFEWPDGDRVEDRIYPRSRY